MLFAGLLMVVAGMTDPSIQNRTQGGGPAAEPVRRISGRSRAKTTLFARLLMVVAGMPDPSNKRSQPISRVLSRTIIHLGSASPQTSSDLPGNLHGPCVQTTS